ncbi:MAG: peptidoglycan-associated lipoprotein Pal, partial [Verrucomicrobiae bacterium]|nr:peptidoglycan-associated lipoprotein Pal [Verrucomicrobiae bacterium]
MAVSDIRFSAARYRGILALLICAAPLALAACANKEGEGADSALLGPNSGKGGPVTPGTSRDFQVNVGDIVYFSSDSTDLTPEAQTTLQKQARWLAQYPQYTITIEGHADERGTREYNIALGSRRATAVRGYLSQNGVNGARIRTVSYGKERPVAVCNDISCWSQNRRAQTVLQQAASRADQASRRLSAQSLADKDGAISAVSGARVGHPRADGGLRMQVASGTDGG